MKRILGLDLGTNSIGWGLIQIDFDKKVGNINGAGSRIIPMAQDILSTFETGQSYSQTADRTNYRSIRRLYQRAKLRRERLHRVLNVIGFLPEHYKNNIDFEKKIGQFKPGKEPKINYLPVQGNAKTRYNFLFKDSFEEMVQEFKEQGYEDAIPYDWTIYYLRKKALSEKISKQELAWILLNFNQKRGYYQLRGEEEETKSDKKEEFFELKVVNVEATEDSSQSGTWYNIHLENGWIYKRKSKDPLDHWMNLSKEFIVTTSLNQDGTEKHDKDGLVLRSFRAPKEDDWGLVKKRTESTLKKSGLHVGAFIYKNLLKKPQQKIRGSLIKTIERKYYKKELEAILDQQIKHHQELQSEELYVETINNLYPKNTSHQLELREKGFKYLFVEDIIFYQRPLKSQKHLIANCQYEKRFYINKNGEKIEAPVKGIPKSHPLFQEFRIWQFLSNLRFYDRTKLKNGEELNITDQLLKSEQDLVELYEWLSIQKEVDQNKIHQYFTKKKLIPKQRKENPDIRWNFPEDKKYAMGELRAQLLSCLQKVEGIKADIFLTRQIELQLWHIIYSVRDKNEYEKGILRQTTFPYDLAKLFKNLKSYDLLKSTPFGNTITQDFAIAAILF